MLQLWRSRTYGMPLSCYTKTGADDSRDTAPRPLSQAPSEGNAITVERGDIK